MSVPVHGVGVGPGRTAEIAAKVEALGAARALLQESFSGGYEAQLDREARSISTAGGSAECREGLAAYFAKRPPNFSGSAECREGLAAYFAKRPPNFKGT